MGGEKMEDDVFRAGGVLNDGEYTGDRATEIGGIQGHCYVDSCVIAFFSISKCLGFLEFRQFSGEDEVEDEDENGGQEVECRWHGGCCRGEC